MSLIQEGWHPCGDVWSQGPSSGDDARGQQGGVRAEGTAWRRRSGLGEPPARPPARHGIWASGRQRRARGNVCSWSRPRQPNPPGFCPGGNGAQARGLGAAWPGQGPRPGVGAAPSGSRRRVWAGAFHGHGAFRVRPTPWKALHERGQCLGDQPPPRATRLTRRGGGPAAGHTAGRWPSWIRTQAARLGPGRCGEARGSGRSLAPGGGGGSSAPCSRRSSDSAAPLAWRGVQAWH